MICINSRKSFAGLASYRRHRLASQLRKAADVDGMRIRRRPGAVRSPAEDLVARLRGVEGVPEEVLAPVAAWRLEREARYLPVVPPDSAAPRIRHVESCKNQTQVRSYEKITLVRS